MDCRANSRLDQSQPTALPRFRALCANRGGLRPSRHGPPHAPTLDQASSLFLNPNFLDRLLVLVLRLRTAPFYGITHIVDYKDREGGHALPLFGTKRFVEWLPRLGEFIQIG